MAEVGGKINITKLYSKSPEYQGARGFLKRMVIPVNFIGKKDSCFQICLATCILALR